VNTLKKFCWSHLAGALGLVLVQNGQCVLFMRTTDIVRGWWHAGSQGLRPPSPSSTLADPRRYRLRHHHGQPALPRIGQDFSDQAMTLAAIDRLAHLATILKMNFGSYRWKAAFKRKARPAIKRDVAGAHGDYRRDPSDRRQGSYFGVSSRGIADMDRILSPNDP